MKHGRPNTIDLDGEIHRATVLVVTKSDGRGPREFRLVREDETVSVEDGMQFVVCYVKDGVLDQPTN